MPTKLIYFNAYGRGEAIRMALNHAKVEFEDERVADFAAFAELKKSHPENFPNGQVPVLI